MPGTVGISTYVDFIYVEELQKYAASQMVPHDPINQLITVTTTIDFYRLIANLTAGDFVAAREQVAAACTSLEAAGADFIVVTSGTTSTLIDEARQRVTIPFLSLADSCIRHDLITPDIGVLCTTFAERGGIFQSAAGAIGLHTYFPSQVTTAKVDRIIFDELVRGIVTDECVHTLSDAIVELRELGASSVILGNTDMSLVAHKLESRTQIPLIDSARIHARTAAKTALSGALPFRF